MAGSVVSPLAFKDFQRKNKGGKRKEVTHTVLELLMHRTDEEKVGLCQRWIQRLGSIQALDPKKEEKQVRVI